MRPRVAAHNHESETERMARRLVEAARASLKVDGAALYWWAAEAEVLVALAHDTARPSRPPLITHPGRGATGRAFTLGEPVVVGRYAVWPHALPGWAASGVKTVVAVPIAHHGRPAGVLVAWSYAGRRVTRRHATLLTGLTMHVESAAPLLSAVVGLELRRAEAATLAEMMAHGIADRDAIPALVTERAGLLLGADYAALALMTPDHGTSWQGSWGTRSDIWHTTRLGSGDEITGRALAMGDTIVIERLSSNPEYPAHEFPLQWAEGGHTVLGTPVALRERAIGVLVVGWRTDVAPSHTLRSTATTLASYAASLLAPEARPATSVGARVDGADQSLQAVLEALRCGVISWDASNRVVHANQAAQQVLGMTPGEMTESEALRNVWALAMLAGKRAQHAGHPLLGSLLTTLPGPSGELALRRPDGQQLWLRMVAEPVMSSAGSATPVLGGFVDVTAYKLNEERLSLENAVIRAFASAPSGDQALATILRTIGERLGWETGAFWEIDPHANVLRCRHVWNRDGVTATAYTASSYRTSLPPGIDLPGRVWADATPRWVPDVTSEANVPRAPAFSSDGLRTAVCVPIISHSVVLGAMEYCEREEHPVNMVALHTLAGLGAEMGPLIERWRRQDAVRNRARTLQHAVSRAPLVLFTTDREGALTCVEGQELERLLLVPDRLVGRSAFDVWTRRPWLLDGVRYALVGGTTTTIDKDEATGITFETWCIPLRDDQGTTIGMLGLAVSQS